MSWATHNRGKPITPRQLAKLLSGYGIKPKTVRFGNSTPKGYERSQFDDAFARYLPDPGKMPQQRNEPSKATDGGDARVAATPESDATPIPLAKLDFGGVADDPEDVAGERKGSTPSSSDPEDLF